MKRVLIIEDNEQNLYLMKFIVEKLGHEVLSSRDGREGLRRAAAETPDLILLDIQLPVMDGYTVAQRIREEPSMAAIPIIAVTSFAMLGDREKCIRSGCTAYMEKPIDVRDFTEEVRRLLDTPQTGIA